MQITPACYTVLWGEEDETYHTRAFDEPAMGQHTVSGVQWSASAHITTALYNADSSHFSAYTQHRSSTDGWGELPHHVGKELLKYFLENACESSSSQRAAAELDALLLEYVDAGEAEVEGGADSLFLVQNP